LLSVVVACALGGLLLHACSAGGDSKLNDTLGPGGNGTGSGGGILFDADTGDGALSDATACADESYPGELVLVDLYIMLDHSASMVQDTDKWGAVTSAITTFLGSFDEGGVGVGIQYFPIPPPPGTQIPLNCVTTADCGLYGPCVPILNKCSGALAPDTSCDPADYDEPAVAISELPGVKSAILTSMGDMDPDGDATPTQQAMQGAVAYAVGWAAANPSHLTFIVFATDGEPTGCTTNSITETANLAQGAANGTPQVKTFVIGVGTELSALNSIAQAGGTDQAYLVDTGQNVTTQFIEALNEIRSAGLCKFQIPVPTTGQPDFNKVNVSLVDPNDANNAETIPYVGDEASCHAITGGWYYDNPADPHMIVLCDASCDKVKLSDWNINVLLGCKTISN